MIMSDADLRAAFAAHVVESTVFTRRMVVALSDMDGTTPRTLVRRCSRLRLLKAGSWDWFVENGGITKEQVEQVRAERRSAMGACG